MLLILISYEGSKSPLKNYDNGTSKKMQTKLVQTSNLEGPSAKSKCNGFINIFMDFLTNNF